jgi:Ca2+-binding RTX toxin-like protein
VTERSVANPVAGATALGVGILAAILAVVLAFSVFAKPSGAQTTPLTLTVEVDPAQVNFGTAVTDDRVFEGTVVTKEITVTNDGPTPITIGGVELTGDAGEILDFSTNIDPDSGLTVAAGGTNTFEVTFNPDAEGTREAVLTFTEGLVDGTIADVIVLVDESGETVQGIDLTGTGTNPNTNPNPTPAADCTIVGTPGDDNIPGTSGNDVICAMGGNDTVTSSDGNDVIRGGSGKDRLTDLSGTDKLYGQGSGDRLKTKDGQPGDTVKGGPKFDRVAKDKGDVGKKDRRRR